MDTPGKKQAVPFNEAIPGAAIAVHTFGDFQQFNPHLHLIATDGCFYAGGTFAKGSAAEAKDSEELFRYQVLKMLKAEGKINDAVIENMLSWRHSGFNVYCGPTIWPNNDLTPLSCCLPNQVTRSAPRIGDFGAQYLTCVSPVNASPPTI